MAKLNTVPVPVVDGSELWDAKENSAEACAALYKDAIENENRQSNRRTWAGKLASMYDNIAVSSFADADYTNPGDYAIEDKTPQIWEEASSLMDTLQSKIAALDEPKPQVMVTDGQYSDHRKGVWLDRFISGQYSEQQGIFRDLFDLWRHAFLVSIVATGTVAVRFEADELAGKVTARIRDTLDMWCDDACGYPMRWGDVDWRDAERLADHYGGTKASIIWNAAKNPKDRNPREAEGWQSRGRLVRVVEGWSCQYGDFKGRWLRTVEGHVLEDEPYPFDVPPHVLLTPKRRLKGVWGRAPLQVVYEAIREENRVAAALGRSERRTAQVVCFYDPTVVEKNKLTLPTNVTLIPYDSTIGPPPVPFNPGFFHQNSIQYIDLHNRKIHDIPGVAEMHTAGNRPQGIDAAVAIRAVAGLLNERQGMPQRAFVNAVAVDSAKQIARACKQLADKNPKFLSKWKGQGFLRTIPAKNVMGALDDERYTYNVAAVAGTKDTPADRLQNAWELVQQKVISGDTYLAIKQSMDLQGETSRNDTQRQFLFDQIEKWLDATLAESQEPGFYEAPDEWMNHLDALGQVSDEYYKARMHGAPTHVRELFLSYLTDLSDAYDRKRTKDAQLAGMSRGSQQQAQPLGPRPAPGPQTIPTPAAAPGQSAQPAAAA